MKKLLFAILIAFIGYQFFTKEQVAAPDLPQTISLEHYAISSGDLVLVNRDIELQQDPTNLAQIPMDIAANVIVDSTFLLENQAIQPLKQLFEAAQQDDIHHFIINSAYRSGKLQQQLFEKNGADYALPSGYSEHQTGLSLDIGSTAGKMENVAEGKWLEQNAPKYGFILRYPKHKVDVTGINYEPWHFRYVGLPHSVTMQKKDMVLEEYIQFVKKEQSYTTKVNGSTYFVQYTTDMSTVNIPNTDNFNVSGDNKNGYIITSIME
ncbi:MAG TPA: M15 family metallopeptidase [Solibacillus sp.]